MIASPHDALFKAIFAQIRHACGTLRHLLPAPVAAQIDWSTLKLLPGSFVDKLLGQQHTDLLYSASWRNSDAPAMQLLFEHQSTVPSEGMMALRLLHYQDRIWHRWHTDYPSPRTLPATLPIVLYHGESAWTEAQEFSELFDMPASARSALGPSLIRFPYTLYDLATISDDELRETATHTALAKLTILCLKHVRTRKDFLDIFRRWLDAAREVLQEPNGREALEPVLQYIFHVSPCIQQHELESFLQAELGPQAKDIIVATGPQLIQQGVQQGIQQGVQQGIQQGVQQGIQQGVQQGIQQVLLRQLRKRFGSAVDARIEQRLADGSAQQLEAWAEHVLTATTLADVFAD